MVLGRDKGGAVTIEGRGHVGDIGGISVLTTLGLRRGADLPGVVATRWGVKNRVKDKTRIRREDERRSSTFNCRHQREAPGNVRELLGSEDSEVIDFLFERAQQLLG